MKGYNFSDQEIADALSARGLYTAAGSGTTTQPEQVTGIINQQLQTGDDGPKGDFGIFGNFSKIFRFLIEKICFSVSPGKPMQNHL